MRLTKEQFAQLAEALERAFPSSDDLKRMVRTELDENLESIARTGDLETVIHNLIVDAEARGQVDELVFGAYEKNPGNPELKAFVNSFRQSDLVEKIGDIENWISAKTLKTFYRKSLPDSDIPKKTQSSLEMAQYLSKFPFNTEMKGFPLFVFAERLIRHLRFKDEDLALRLQKTLEKMAGKMQIDLLSLRENLDCEPPDEEASLLIVIKPREESDETKTSDETSKYYVEVTYWQDKNNSNPWIKDEESQKLEDLESFLDSHLKRRDIPDRIEFFLPRELISEEVEVDLWKYEVLGDFEPYGQEYKVIVRSLDRIKCAKENLKLKNFWLKKWELFSQKPANCIHFVSEKRIHTPKKLRCLKKDDFVCLMMAFSLISNEKFPKNDLGALIRYGLPIALWPRCSSPEFAQEMEKIKNSDLTQLLETVKAKRIEAEEDDNHIGRHLTLLWDDPNRVPLGMWQDDTNPASKQMHRMGVPT